VRRAGANSITIANGDAYESRRGKEERGGGQAGGRAGGRAVDADDLLWSGRLDRLARASCPFIVRQRAYYVMHSVCCYVQASLGIYGNADLGRCGRFTSRERNTPPINP
jgi:hypothetical protein